MKRTVLFLGIIGLALGLGASAAPLSVCSYISPETNLQSLGLSMSYRYYDDWATPGVDASGGRAALDFSRLYDSPDFGYTLTGNAELLLANFLPTSGLGDAAGTFRYYFTQDAPAFGFGGVEASVATGQPQPAVHISAGLGYGRFSDVTPLAKAFKIETELRKANAIRNPLGDSALMGIAKVIGTVYASTKDQVADVVNQIQVASGVALDPRLVLKVEDLVLATGDERFCGWAVQAGVGYQLVDPYNQPQGFLVTASADAAFVPNPDGQVLFHAGLSGPLNILDQNTLRVRASYDYVLSETSLLRATYTLLQVQPLGQPASTSQIAALLLGFVVGRADMGLQVSLSKPANASAWSIDVSVSAAINFVY
ncbi:MAG: hypothetical protein NT125_00750 [Candidatus Bipolaricaulota bacterium]|nr:hypothetical protein [Candidatus Bipolaricaulota bacterium]